jgi:hypothetical protein
MPTTASRKHPSRYWSLLCQVLILSALTLSLLGACRGETPTATPTPQSATLAGGPPSLRVGSTTVLQLRVRFTDGTLQSCPSPITFNSADERVAKVDNSGTVTAIAVGFTSVSAACGNLTASRNIAVVVQPMLRFLDTSTVVAPLASRLADLPKLFVTDSLGRPVGNVRVQFSLSDSTASLSQSEVVSDGSGTVVTPRLNAGLREQRALITASAEGFATASLSVRFELTPGTIRLKELKGARFGELGQNTFCGIDVSDQAWCWGTHLSGIASSTPDGKPTRIVGLPPVRSLMLIATGACAITTIGDVYCWGTNYLGILGKADVNKVLNRVSLPAKADQLWRATWSTLCARLVDSRVYCWGRALGFLFDAPITTTGPVEVAWLKSASFLAGDYHNGLFYCAADSSMALRCRGWMFAADQRSPGVPFPEVRLTRYIDCQNDSICGYRADGRLVQYRFVNASFGSYKVDSTIFDLEPNASFEGVVGGVAMCWVYQFAKCQGEFQAGADGTGDPGFGFTRRVSLAKPTPVQGGNSFLWITTLHEQTCAIDSRQRTYCWGLNAQGSLGIGLVEASPTIYASPRLLAGSPEK